MWKTKIGEFKATGGPSHAPLELSVVINNDFEVLEKHSKEEDTMGNIVEELDRHIVNEPRKDMVLGPTPSVLMDNILC